MSLSRRDGNRSGRPTGVYGLAYNRADQVAHSFSNSFVWFSLHLKIAVLQARIIDQQLPHQHDFTDLYVAVLRVTYREGLKILITDEDGEDTEMTFNVVYEKIFCNV
ncbi:hypothetical protein MTR_2g016010 [Medicago truncatula]|uniref:Uncharacterized protein n=1 Tax=Medicago truncatula TaxID=3880 RepID=A0A072V409_MEDTR|nr:hypothetical protein MTR_2g016010 [Medicago truncatula]